MSSKDPFAEASALWPHEDPDEINLAAWSATWRWRGTIAPFLDVKFPHIGLEMGRIGRGLTAHVDAEALARRSAKRKERLDALFAMYDEAAKAFTESDITLDAVATGW